MAKSNKTTGEYAPGIIYELRCKIDDIWHPFYVGETTDAEQRKKSHAGSSRADTRLVYQFIRETLTPNNIEWDLFPVEHYGTEGPTDLEHEHIMQLLYDGVRLKNMKKGSDVWMQKQLVIAEDMRTRGIRSYRKYREVVDQETQARVAQARQAQWLAEEQRSQIIRDIEQKRTQINAQEQQAKKIKHERDAKKALELGEIRAQQQAAWEAQRAREAEAADLERARQRKETLAQKIAAAAEADRQAALAAARAEAFAKEWPEHEARLQERERMKAEFAQNRRDITRYMQQLELERKMK